MFRAAKPHFSAMRHDFGKLQRLVAQRKREPKFEKPLCLLLQANSKTISGSQDSSDARKERIQGTMCSAKKQKDIRLLAGRQKARYANRGSHSLAEIPKENDEVRTRCHGRIVK